MQRRKGNRFDNLEKENRMECSNKEEVVEEVYKFYETLFTSKDLGGWESKLDGIDPTITEHINSDSSDQLSTVKSKKLFSL